MVGSLGEARSMLFSAWALWKLGCYWGGSVVVFWVCEAVVGLVREMLFYDMVDVGEVGGGVVEEVVVGGVETEGLQVEL